MAELRNERMKLIVTSPPYNLGKEYLNREHRSTLTSKSQERVIRECVRLLHPKGSICWQVGNYVENEQIIPLDTIRYPDVRAQGLVTPLWESFGISATAFIAPSGSRADTRPLTGGRRSMITNRISTRYGCRQNIPAKNISIGPNIGKLSGNPKGMNPSDVWTFPNVKSNHPEKTIHPCQFPVELVERLVVSMTDEGDAVFDPYMGVGSSSIAALNARENGLWL